MVANVNEKLTGYLKIGFGVLEIIILKNKWMQGLFSFFTHQSSLIAIISFVAFFLSIKLFPIIIQLSREKKLMADLCDRSSHSEATPNLGGVGIFVVFSLCLMFSGVVFEYSQVEMKQLLALLSGITILFFIGVKDDLIGVLPIKKLLGQIAVAFMVVLMTNLRIDTILGVLGVDTLAYIPSVLFTVIMYVFFINAYNLIDGIDGLAGSIAIIASLFFGVYFVSNQLYFASIVSFTLVACLVGFLVFNFSKNKKLFMGDSGSMFIGVLLMFQALIFLKMDIITQNNIFVPNKIALVTATFCFPIIDTIRVFAIRLLKGMSPMSADRNHVHHKILDAGFSHIQATLFIAISNLVVISMVYFIVDYNINIQLFIVFSSLLLIVYLFLKLNYRSKKIVVTFSNKLFARKFYK